MMRLPALTLQQPWATALVHPAIPKTIETRGRRIPAKYLNVDIAIIAGKAVPAEAVPLSIGGWTVAWPSRRPAGGDWPVVHGPDGATIVLPLGAIVGTVRFKDCCPIAHPDGGWGWSDHEATTLYVQGGSADDDDDILVASGPGFEHDEFTPNRPWGDYTPGRWGWVTDPAHTRLLAEPIPARGALTWPIVEIPSDAKWAPS